jgi:hypothetical protein
MRTQHQGCPRRNEVLSTIEDHARSAADASSGVSSPVCSINDVGDQVRSTADRAGSIEGKCRELSNTASDLKGLVNQYNA